MIPALAACAPVFDETHRPEGDTLVAMTIVAEGTRTTLQEDLSVRWNRGDAISVFDEEGNHRFETDSEGSRVEFTGLAAASADPKPVLYPYDEYASADLSEGTLRTFIPGRQTGRKGSFGSVNNVAVGVARNGAFYARNVCGLIKLTVSRDDLVSIDVISRNTTKKLAGWVSIDYSSADPSASLTSEGSHIVSLSAEDEGTLGAGTYYLDAIPSVLSAGYTIRTTSSTGEVSSREFGVCKTIERSGVTDFGVIDGSYGTGHVQLDLGFFDFDAEEPGQPFTTAIPTSYVTDRAVDYTFSSEGKSYIFSIYSKSGFRLEASSSYRGLRMSCAQAEAWIKLPAIPGKALKRVSMLSGTTMSNAKEIRLVSGLTENEIANPVLVMNLKGSSAPEEYSQFVPESQPEKTYYLYIPATTVANTVLARLRLDYSNESISSPYFVRVKNRGETSWTMCNEAKTVRTIPGFCPVGEPDLDEYGGWKGVFTFPATGWFYCAQRDGRWWMVDPLGNPFISKGLCGFRLDLSSQVAKDAFASVYGSDYSRWAPGEWEMLRSYGFNSFGAFSNTAKIRDLLDVPYTVLISPRSAYMKSIKDECIAKYGLENWTDSGPFGFPMVFDSGFDACVEKAAQGLVPYADDPFMMGVMSDNEWPVENNFLDLCLNWPDRNHINYKKAVAWLEENEVTAEAALASLDWKRRFAAFCYDTYLCKLSAAVRKYAPNHMYLGSKLTGNNHGLANDYAFEAAAGYVQAMSIDWYHVWTPSEARLQRMAELCKAPVILAEWYAKGEDTDPQDKLTNTTGVGYTVPTQTDRGLFYQNYVLAGLRSGAVVGWHWFRYMDNDPDGADPDNPSNIDANKGVVTRRLTPYTQLLDQMYMVNSQVYPICQFYQQ